MELVGRLVLLLIALAAGAAATYFLLVSRWPPFVVVALDIGVWVVVGSSMVGLLRNSDHTERGIVDQLRTRARRRNP